ncbi:hypothetical protein J6590_041657 [Homalodisca vitripennis]|nr:hypothetical protein J6590_041657 [Homalodisca vitripennis]
MLYRRYIVTVTLTTFTFFYRPSFITFSNFDSSRNSRLTIDMLRCSTAVNVVWISPGSSPVDETGDWDIPGLLEDMSLKIADVGLSTSTPTSILDGKGDKYFNLMFLQDVETESYIPESQLENDVTLDEIQMVNNDMLSTMIPHFKQMAPLQKLEVRSQIQQLVVDELGARSTISRGQSHTHCHRRGRLEVLVYEFYEIYHVSMVACSSTACAECRVPFTNHDLPSRFATDTSVRRPYRSRDRPLVLLRWKLDSFL